MLCKENDALSIAAKSRIHELYTGVSLSHYNALSGCLQFGVFFGTKSTMHRNFTILITTAFLLLFGVIDVSQVLLNPGISQQDESTKIKRILVIMPGRLQHVHGICNRYLSMKQEMVQMGIEMDIMDASDADFEIGNLGIPQMPENILSFSLPRKYVNRYLSGNYDAVHIAEIATSQSIMAAMTFAYYDVPFTMSCHVNYDIYNRLYGNYVPANWYQYIARFSTKKAKCIYVPTKGIAELMRKTYGLRRRKIIELSNGFDNKIFNTDRGPEYEKVKNYLENELKLKRPYLICVSRIAPEKSLEEFFNLDFNGSKIMIGDGPCLPEYRDKYSDKVTFVGMKREKELAAYYANGDVFVFPSRSETFGVVMVESMACGTPVAAYPCIGPIDVVDDNITGCLDNDLRRATERCLRLPRDRVAEGARKWDWHRPTEEFLRHLCLVPVSVRRKLALIYNKGLPKSDS